MWNLEKYSDNIALIADTGSIVTYSMLNILQENFSNNLKARSLILIVCTNTLESITAYISSLLNKLIPLLCDCSMKIDMLSSIIAEYMPEYIYAPITAFEGISGYQVIRKDSIYILYATEKRRKYKINKELALLLPTSGSTGSSKYVKLSYKNIKANTIDIINFLHIKEKDRTITSLPMCYAYGISVINTYLYAGASIVVTEKKIVHPFFWQLMEEKSVTSFSGVPYMYELCHKLNIFSKNFQDIRVFTQAGGKMDLELQKYFGEYCKKFRKKFFIMYGQTEATARMSYLNPSKILTKPNSIGKPVGGTFTLWNENGEEIFKPYEEGEIIYKGKNVFMGYSHTYNDLNTDDERDGVLQTGDCGYFDDEGYWYVIGRNDKYVKLLGKRIDLAELEHILFKQYGESFICSLKGKKIEICGECGDVEILKFISEKLGVNRGMLHFTQTKISKWKES